MITRALRKGCVGSDVASWQNFLIGYFMSLGQSHNDLITDADFGTETEAHTRLFQKSVDLPQTGIVDKWTLVAAMQKGFGILEDDPPVDKLDPLWPPNNYGLEPLSAIDKAELFGTFSYRPTPVAGCLEAITVTNAKNFQVDWVEIPQLAGVEGAPSNRKVQFNAKCKQQLLKLFKEWDDAGLRGHVLSWAGSYAPRFVRGSQVTLSSHAWGTAFDINAGWNPLGAQPALLGQKGSVRDLVEIAAQHGFYWGGWFGYVKNGRPDGMHFEVCKII